MYFNVPALDSVIIAFAITTVGELTTSSFIKLNMLVSPVALCPSL